jgi:hypothetical protein
MKLDTAGNFFGGVGAEFFTYDHSRCRDDEGNVYVIGTFQGSPDFDPGPGVYNLTSAGMEDVYVTKTRQAAPLPVNLVSFSVEQNGPHNQLHWQTATEENMRAFTIERSGDGSRFSSIGSVTANGNSSSAKTYSFSDVKPLAGTSFYRLQITDLDGKFTYSNVVAVRRNETAKALQLFPNPANNVLYIQASIGDGMATVQIIDAAGRMVRQQQEAISGNTSFTIDVQALPRGTYRLLLQLNHRKEVQPFIKQ